ncbi:MAG: DEAD/DEAH box helicase [Anaerolineae bacterium]|nr:DEAD/DEAH box helicase [Anaerolineae bacterium]
MTVKTERETGTIKWYNRKKGFGFITPDAGAEEIFLHHSALQRSSQAHVEPGDRITFFIEQRKKGPSAVDVSRVDGQSSAPARENGNGRSNGKQNGNGNGNGHSVQTPVAEREHVSADGGFSELDLIDSIQRAIRDAGYDEPTPIQTQAIPYVLDGRDMMGCAQTGTGKTAAFALPIINHLATSHNGNGHKKVARPIRALVVSPTRELAIQIADNFRDYGKYTSLTNTIVYGGVKQHAQVKALQKGVDILVATPGRLLDLMGQGFIKLDRVEVLVLDEADRMLDMGFIHDMRRIVKAVPDKRQTLMFSATMVGEIKKLANEFLHDPVEVTVSPEQPTVEAIEQSVYFTTKKKKQALLEHLLKDPALSRVLVFSRTKHGANRIVKNLVQRGIHAEPIHGNKSQGARQQALKNFRKGKTRVLVATDVAARGIDVDLISHVIQFDLPNEPETYVHRIGRTGRAGEDGIAISFCGDDERAYLRDIEKLIKTHVPVVKDHNYRA